MVLEQLKWLLALILGTVLVAMLSMAVFGGSLEYAYKRTQVPNSQSSFADFSTNFRTNRLENTFRAKHLSTVQGNSLYLRINSDYDIGRWSFFGFSELTDDEILDIEAVDFGLGLGFRLSNGKLVKQKISAALILRNNKILESYRYKVKLNKEKVSSHLIAQYLTKVRIFLGEASVGYKVSDKAGIGYKIDFGRKAGLDRYFQSTFFKYSF